ncbi:MAG: pyridoxamine 5'-phosphate oxidase [Actinomycetota bacterium]
MTDPGSMQAPTGAHDHGALHRTDLAPDPIVQFVMWLSEADAAGVPLANAIALATADARGAPSVRHVLLRGVEPEGFVFYTNHASRKGRELAENPLTSFTVLWRELDRQVCVRGRVEQVPAEASDAYFATRPREAQIGAWASHQSEPLTDRQELEGRVAQATERFEGADVPRPSFWGGYLLAPDQVEFWQGRRFRLHDRFRYAHEAGGWRVERLSP